MKRRFVAGLFGAAGLFIYPGQSLAQTAPRGQAETELPLNPKLVTPVPPAPDAVTVPEDTVRAPKVRVGINGGVMSRPAKSSEVTYEPGFTWGGHVGIPLLPWFSLRASSQVTSHEVKFHDGALGLDSPGFDPPHLRELALAGAVELRKSVAPRIAVWGGGGVAWTRLSMSRFSLEAPWPAAVETRSGVTLELPLHAGVGCVLGRPIETIELALTVEFRFSPVLSSSGDLFSPGPGQNETVRSDTGARVEIGGMPEVTAARVVLLGIEATLF